MEITKPRYYDRFRCIASACPDSCCHEWEVQVDDASARRYRSLPGSLGDDLRSALRDEDGETFLTIQDGRCPMWRQDGLCRIQAELGEDALCHVCRQFPRLRHDYGDFVELGLELSCPEAARLILSSQGETVTEQLPEDAEADYDTEAMASLKSTREIALELVTNPGRTPGETLTLLLFYGCLAQQELDGSDPIPFDQISAMENAAMLAQQGDLTELLEFFLHLELLTPRWEALLRQPHSVRLPPATHALARYLIQRYWLQAISDYDLMSRVKFIVAACLLVGSLGGNYIDTAQLFSKEIENDADNLDAILDAAYTSPAFSDARLLGLLRSAGD